MGVSWAPHMNAWMAGIVVDYVYYSLGYHEDEEDAARAYDGKAWELGGKGPYNFPDELPGARPKRRKR